MYKKILLCSIVTVPLLRNTYVKQLDITPNEFCSYLSPEKTNYLFFDYYEYCIRAHEDNTPPCYYIRNYSFAPIMFINKENYHLKNNKCIEAPYLHIDMFIRNKFSKKNQ